jgi:hypothetical protein
MYVALAQRMQVKLVTQDQRLIGALRRHGLGDAACSIDHILDADSQSPYF